MMKHTQKIIPFLLLLILVLLSGCDNSLKFQIRFGAISGLTQEAPVYFQHNKIGTVTDVRYTEQGTYLVGVAIEKAFCHATTASSHFYIDTVPEHPQAPVVIVMQDSPGGTPLAPHSTVNGEKYPGLFDNLTHVLTQQSSEAERHLKELLDDFNHSMKETSSELDRQMQKTLNDIKIQLQQFSEEIKNLPQEEEIERFNTSLQELGKELQTAQEDVRTHIETVILPNIKKQLDELRKRFQKEGKDKDVQEIDHMQKQIDTMI